MPMIADHPDIEKIEKTGYLYELKTIGVCEECGFEITEDYEMYKCEGKILCDECMDEKLEKLKKEYLVELCS